MRSFVDARKPASSSSILSTALDAEQEWRGSWQGRVLLSAFLVLSVAHMTARRNPYLSPLEWQLRVGIVALMVVATIVLAAAPRIFRSGRERMAIALGSFAELAMWCGFLISSEIGNYGIASDTLGLTFGVVGVLIIVWAALHLPLLRKLSRRPEST